MAFEFASWVLFLHLLLALMHGAIGANVIRLNTMDEGEHEVHHHDHMHQDHAHAHGHGHHSSSSADPIDPQLTFFYMLDDLKIGAVMSIHFPNRNLSQLLSKQEADSIPFSLKELPHLLHLFSFSEGSPQAMAMENTLTGCESKPVKGEIKFCATSMESAHIFTREIFGSHTQLKTLSTTHLNNPPSGLLQNYRVVEILHDIPAPKLVPCHTLPYAYAVFYCHSQGSDNRVLMVILEGEDGSLVNALSVCHMDTSQWSRSHPAFNVLGVEPGTTSVCHFFPSDHFVFIPSSTTM